MHLVVRLRSYVMNKQVPQRRFAGNASKTLISAWYLTVARRRCEPLFVSSVFVLYRVALVCSYPCGHAFLPFLRMSAAVCQHVYVCSSSCTRRMFPHVRTSGFMSIPIESLFSTALQARSIGTPHPTKQLKLHNLSNTPSKFL